MQLVSKISNLRGPDPPTLQTDRQSRTDDMQSQYRVLHYSASRGRNQRRHNKANGDHYHNHTIQQFTRMFHYCFITGTLMIRVTGLCLTDPMECKTETTSRK